MIITCSTITDFLENLDGVGVYQDTVYINKFWDPINGNKRTASSFDVSLQASAIIEFGDGCQALVQCGEDCGVDRHTSDGDLEGSKKQQELFQIVTDFCSGHKLVVKPGLIDQTN